MNTPPIDHPTASTPTQGSAAGSEGLCRLDDWGLMRAQGAEAAKFLHGQLTQDVEHLPANASRLAGYCSVKGRLLATMLMWRGGPEEILLACSADLLPATLKRLSMFVMRAKCKLSDASAELPLWGLDGPAAQAAVQAAVAAAVDSGSTAAAPAIGSRLAIWGGDLLRLPDVMPQVMPEAQTAGDGAGPAVQRYLFAGARPEALADLPALDSEHWRWLEARSAVARVMAATSEHFVPQMLNLEVVGGVNFQKGCFPGQEVVARSQYRGTLKRRAFVLSSPVALQAGQEIFHSADPGQPAGMVALAGSSVQGEHAALAELKLAALESGSLHAGSGDGPVLQLLGLPYTLPAPEVA